MRNALATILALPPLFGFDEKENDDGDVDVDNGCGVDDDDVGDDDNVVGCIFASCL